MSIMDAINGKITCEDCGREMKSKGGMTLHKKKCKPKEMFQQMQISLTNKLLYTLKGAFQDCEVYTNTSTIVIGTRQECKAGETKHKWIRKKNMHSTYYSNLQVKCVFITTGKLFPRIGLRIDDGQVAICPGRMNGHNDIYVGKPMGDPDWDAEKSIMDAIKIVRMMLEIGKFAEKSRL
jgi:hypothetical protein